jgi:uncharacterized protein (TIGR00661 family)
MIDYTGRKILFGIMDWGLGHAGRMIPVIQKLKDENEITIASHGHALELLKNYFPEIEVVEKPGYNIRYSKYNLTTKLIFQLPKFLNAVKEENRWVDGFTNRRKTDLIISDNCYGFHKKEIESVFITHQLNIKSPSFLTWTNFFTRRFIHSKIKHFTNCLVPDFENGQNLSGDLSHNHKLNGKVKYIGPISRLKDAREDTFTEPADVLVLLSGPEPQRTILEKMIVDLFRNKSQRVLIVRGIPGKVEEEIIHPNIFLFSSLSDERLKYLMMTAGKIICRSGYSTLMDLHAIGKTAICVPTPGQSEQEYLAVHNAPKGFITVKQSALKQKNFVI